MEKNIDPHLDISFRGKDTTGVWRRGYYVHNWGEDKHFIVDDHDQTDKWQVSPDSVARWTGFNDKNGTMVFEGDIARSSHYLKDGFYIVFSWDRDLLTFKGVIYADGVPCEDVYFIDTDSSKYEVVGNIIDDGHLLTPTE